MLKKDKTVLLVAYACEPNQTSEPGVGWNFSKEISKSYNTIVLTRENNRKVIEESNRTNATFIYYDLPTFFMKLKKKTPMGAQWYYALWQWGAYRYAKNYILKSEASVDLLHHLNFANIWLSPPSYLVKKPFVWGPIGGGDYIPAKFFGSLNFKSIAQESAYFLINQISRFSILAFWTRKKTNAFLFRTESTKNNFPKMNGKIFQTISETASVTAEYHPKLASKTINAICVGRLIYFKGFMLAVKGFHAFLDNGGQGELEIFGDGPEKERIAEYIKQNNLEKKIHLKGFVDNSEIKRKMKEASVLLHPSFREGGSWSIMEAMSFGMPVICLNTSGPKDMVTKKCGVLINLVSSEQIVKSIGEALSKLQNDPELFELLSNNATNRIKEEYNWERRGEQIAAVYSKILGTTPIP